MCRANNNVSTLPVVSVSANYGFKPTMPTVTAFVPSSSAPSSSTMVVDSNISVKVGVTPAAGATQQAELATATTPAGIIFANRYKTKLCRHYTEDPVTGDFSCACPYKKKCMFAHQVDELRTPEMNIADGILTKEDIRAFKKRCKVLAQQYQQLQHNFDEDCDGDVEHHNTISGADLCSPQYHSSRRSQTASDGHHSDSHGMSSSGSHSVGSSFSFVPIECPNHQRPYTSQEKAQGFHSHSPYGQHPATANSWEYNSSCNCEQCVSASWYRMQHSY